MAAQLVKNDAIAIFIFDAHLVSIAIELLYGLDIISCQSVTHLFNECRCVREWRRSARGASSVFYAYTLFQQRRTSTTERNPHRNAANMKRLSAIAGVAILSTMALTA